MLELFKRNTFFSLLLLVPYAFILHTGTWLSDVQNPVFKENWLFDIIYHALALRKQTEIFASCILIALQSILIARFVSQFKLVQEGQLFPSILFILLCGIHPQTLNLSAVMLANVFFCLSLNPIFSIYQKKHIALPLYNFGFLIGLSSLFYPPYFILFFLGVLGLILLRGFKPREFFQIIGGFLNVYILFLALLYILNQHVAFYEMQIEAFFSPYIFSYVISSKGWVAFSCMMAILLLCLSSYNFFLVKKSIQHQKIFDLLFWSLFISLFSTFFIELRQIAHLMILFVPVSILCGLLLTRLKNPLISETLHLFLILASLFLQFQNW